MAGIAGEQALAYAGAHVEDGPAVPTGGHETGGLQRLEVGVERRRGETEQGGQLGGGHGQIELAEEGSAGMTEHVCQRGAVLCVRRLPEPAQAARRVGECRLRIGGPDDYVRPGKRAGDEQQAATAQVGVALVVLDHAHCVAVDADQRMQGAQQLPHAAVGKLVEAEGEGGIEQAPHAWPEWRERDLPVPLQLRDSPAAGLAIIWLSRASRAWRPGPCWARGCSARCASWAATSCGSLAAICATPASKLGARRGGNGCRKSGM